MEYDSLKSYIKIFPDNMVDLEPFVEVYGNALKLRRYLLALKFKKPIIKYYTNFVQSASIQLPDNSIIVINGKVPTVIKKGNSLIFTLESDRIPSNRILLASLLPYNSIIEHFYSSEILYVITSQNPFSFWKKCPKTAAFRALQTIINAVVFEDRFLNLEEMTLLRLFKRYSIQLKNFSNWDVVAYILARKSFKQLFKDKYSLLINMPYYSREIYRLIQKSLNYVPLSLPEPSFYECEVLYTSLEPVGILYKRDPDIVYVSPMIVTHPPIFPFKDVNHVDCNYWVPLYKNHENWTNFCIKYYLTHYNSKRFDVQSIISWLYIQTIEKYKLIYLDFVNVAKLLLGNESRWFLDPL